MGELAEGRVYAKIRGRGTGALQTSHFGSVGAIGQGAEVPKREEK